MCGAPDGHCAHSARAHARHRLGELRSVQAASAPREDAGLAPRSIECVGRSTADPAQQEDMTRTTSKQIAEAFAAYPADVEALAYGARKLLLEALPDSMEVLDSSRNVVGYCYGPGYKGTVCTLIMSQKGVKIGIVHGALIDDPDGLMVGAGKSHRHVDVRESADLKQKGLKPLLKRQLSAWKERNR